MGAKRPRMRLDFPGPVPGMRAGVDLGEVPVGGFAFPNPVLFQGGAAGGSGEIALAANGMTLRAWLAGQALAGLAAAKSVTTHAVASDEAIQDLIARAALGVADALIERLTAAPVTPSE